jgi:hypothetical protein
METPNVIESEIKEQAMKVITTLENEKSDVIPHFVTLQAFRSALSALGKEPPIIGTDPVTMSLILAIGRICPGLSVIEKTLVRAEIANYTNKSNFSDRFFERNSK